MINSGSLWDDLSSIQAHIIYVNDKFEYESGVSPKVSFTPARGSRGSAVGAFVIYADKNGAKQLKILPAENIHAAKSPVPIVSRGDLRHRNF